MMTDQPRAALELSTVVDQTTVLDQTAALAALGPAQVDPAHLSRLVARALHIERADVVDVDVSTVDYPSFTIATGALLRVHGHARKTQEGDAVPFRLFVKQLQSARVWPLLHVVPEDQREAWVTSFPWRIEIDAFTSPLASVLPARTRLPALYEIVEIDHDRAAIWMEDVDADPTPWSLDRFRSAAYRLGELSGRRPVGSDTALGAPESNQTPGLSLLMYAAGRLRHGTIPLLDNDEAWEHPALVAALAACGEHSLRADLLSAVPLLDPWLTNMNDLPQTLVHGDASPQNLLVPRDDPDTLVVIDWGFNSPHCVGFDLGQLLLGLVNAGDIAPSMLSAIHRAIEPAYVEGLASTGFPATPEQVHRGYLMSLLVRSLYTTLPLEELDLPDSPALRDRLSGRIAMARFLLTLADEVRP
jgi:hypothetical protein